MIEEPSRNVLLFSLAWQSDEISSAIGNDFGDTNDGPINSPLWCVGKLLVAQTPVEITWSDVCKKEQYLLQTWKCCGHVALPLQIILVLFMDGDGLILWESKGWHELLGHHLFERVWVIPYHSKWYRNYFSLIFSLHHELVLLSNGIMFDKSCQFPDFWSSHSPF